MTQPGSNNGNGNAGWITIHRKLCDTSFYANSRAVHMALHLLLKATHKDRTILVGNYEITLLRGQVLGGIKRLMKELGWHRGQVQRTIYILEASGFLTRYNCPQYSIITLSSYNYYQGIQTEPQGDTNGTMGGYEQTPPGDTNGTPKGDTNGTPYNHYINNKNKYIVQAFENIWLKYPKKLGKKQAFKHYKASIKKFEDIEECEAALINYKNSKTVARDFIQHGSTWFNNWKDWVTDPDPAVDPKIKELEESLKNDNKR